MHKYSVVFMYSIVSHSKLNLQALQLQVCQEMSKSLVGMVFITFKQCAQCCSVWEHIHHKQFNMCELNLFRNFVQNKSTRDFS